LCGRETAFAFTVGDRNRGITDAQFDYRRCRGCGSYFLVNVPGDLGRYYPDDYYQLPTLPELDRLARSHTGKLEVLEPYATRGRLVDVGAAYGIFARAARNAGFDVTAIEMDARCCDYLDRVVGVHAVHSDLPEQALAQLEPVGAITLWHVLEHLPRPFDVIEAAAARLESGGALVVATPNPASLQFRMLGARWAHVDAPRHLFLIPLDALHKRVGDLGLELAFATTDDAEARGWNRFGWEYAIRGCPAKRPPIRGTWTLSQLVTLLMAPLERRSMRGTAYTAVFVKS
jgi:SAM-dependent methyltransferase